MSWTAIKHRFILLFLPLFPHLNPSSGPADSNRPDLIIHTEKPALLQRRDQIPNGIGEEEEKNVEIQRAFHGFFVKFFSVSTPLLKGFPIPDQALPEAGSEV